MESRIRKLEDRFAPPESVQLRVLAEIAAEQSGLDANAILVEAEAVLARMRAAGPRPLDEVAAQEGIPADDLVRVMTELRARWQEVG